MVLYFGALLGAIIGGLLVYGFGRAKNKFSEIRTVSKKILFFGLALGALIGGFVVYGLYLAHRAYVDGTG